MSKPFRFLHFADAHIGYAGNASNHNEFSALRIPKEIGGINVRTLDINDAYRQMIDLALEHQVDAVVDAGDLFDKWGYKENNIYNFVQKQIKRLDDASIPYVGVIGNHDLPKLKNKGTYLDSLSVLNNTHFAFQGFYQPFELEQHGVVFHCVPSTFRQDILDDTLAQVKPVEGKINIGIGHFGVTTIKHYAENALNALVVDLDRLIACDMDYFALGDYHVPTDFGFNIRYAGPLERLGFGEINTKPQVLLVDVNPVTKEVDVTPILLNVRPMMDLPSLDVKGLKVMEINDAIETSLKQEDLRDKIVRFRVLNLPKEYKSLIDDQQIKLLTEDALHFKIEFPDKVNKTKEARTGGTQFVGVLEGWGEFVDAIESDGSFDKDALKQLGYDKILEVFDDVVT